MKLGKERSEIKEISSFQITGDLVGHIIDLGLCPPSDSEKWKTYMSFVLNTRSAGKR